MVATKRSSDSGSHGRLPVLLGLFQLSRLRLQSRFTLERTEPEANAATRVRERRALVSSGVTSATPGQGLRIKFHSVAERLGNFSVKCPWQESNPWGSVLRVICVSIEQSYNRGCTIARCLRRSLIFNEERCLPLEGLYILYATNGQLRASFPKQIRPNPKRVRLYSLRSKSSV